MSTNLVYGFETLAEPVAWALIHTVWQAASLAVLLAVALAVISRKRARLRYALSCATLAATVVAATATGWFLIDVTPEPSYSASPVAARQESRTAVTETEVPKLAATRLAVETTSLIQIDPRTVAPWILVLWMMGVTVLSSYHLFVWGRTRALVRSGVRQAGKIWQEKTGRLCRRVGVSSTVRVLESMRVQVPCVVGWIRPIVLLPTSAFSGMNPEQLELILAHELAHIRRYDILVNYLQTLVETLLFHNPVVWWISRQIRIEREHCCDDTAAVIAGPTVYARALVDLENLRRSEPSFSMAADGTSLLARVRRLVGHSVDRNLSTGLWNVITVLSLVGLATLVVDCHKPTNATSARIISNAQEPTRHDTASAEFEGRWELTGREDRLRLQMKRGSRSHLSFKLRPEELQGFSEGSSKTFCLVRDAGTFAFEGNISSTGDRLEGSGQWAFEVNDSYNQELQRLSFDTPSKRKSLELTIHNVTLDFVRGLDEAGYRGFSLSKLVELRIHDVTPEYVNALAELGYRDLSLSKLVEMQIHDVTPGYVRELRDLGYTDLSGSKLVEMRIHDVEPHFVREMKDLGYDKLSASKLVEMQIHDVDSDFVRELVDLGYRDLRSSKLVEMQIHNVTPSYVRELHDLGYRDISVSKLVEMKIHNVTPDFIRDAERRGYSDLTPSRLIELSIHGKVRQEED
jgi:beta-lactamase regulating signal transducer with metallopeptidase domain